MNLLQSWPEPVVRVQTLAESGIDTIPDRYIKPPSHRPFPKSPQLPRTEVVNIPVVDFLSAFSDNKRVREETLSLVSSACREWGFFQVVNHGVSHELMRKTREMWREFFYLPLEVKQQYSNNPDTYEGYGSRLGVEKDALLDWNDYFFLNYMPSSLRDPNKWPAIPPNCRELVADYGREMVNLGGSLLKVLSKNLGLEEQYLQDAFGGPENVGACMRVNFYPKCPQPDLALGLSPHTDPGGITILMPDENVAGLQVRLGDRWVTVKPTPNAFIINIGDQIKILSNGIYKSVEHRVIVNSDKERLSLALFYNPKGDLVIAPSKQLVTKEHPALFTPMTFNEYRLQIRKNGICGKQES